MYDYTQKAEYWALIWGTILMAVTGAVLMFPDTLTQMAPDELDLDHRPDVPRSLEEAPSRGGEEDSGESGKKSRSVAVRKQGG